MSIADNALCSYEDILQYNDGYVSIAENDALLEDIINDKTQEFHSYCRVDQLLSKTYTERYNGNGTFDLFPSRRPIISITSIYDDTTWAFGSDTLIDSTTYVIIDNYVTMNSNVFTVGNANIQITYVAGYATIPEDVNLACIREVTREFSRRKDFDISAKTLEDGSVSYVEKGLLKSTKDVLRRYRDIGLQ